MGTVLRFPKAPEQLGVIINRIMRQQKAIGRSGKDGTAVLAHRMQIERARKRIIEHFRLKTEREQNPFGKASAQEYISDEFKNKKGKI